MTENNVQIATAVVQTVASVIALCIATVAVIIPARQQKEREKANQTERLLEAKCLATAIRFDLHEILAALSDFDLKAVTRLTALSAAGGVARDLDGGGIVQELQVSKIEIPPTLASRGDRVYILGDPAGPTLLRLIAVLKAYNEAIDTRVNLIFTKPEIPHYEHWRMFKGFVQDVTPIAQQALKEISPVADQ